MRTMVRRTLLVGVGAVTAVAIMGRKTVSGRALQRSADLLARRLRYAHGRLKGIRYRLAGRMPDPGVSDDVLADRIRSSLGSLEKRLDIPRVHVMVGEHVAILHGEIPATADAVAIEGAVTDLPGVRGVESYLHVGLGTEETRPSAGRAQAAGTPSVPLRELLDATERAGASRDDALGAVRAVLATFADRIPADERDQLLAHVPDDVRGLAAAPRRHGERVARVRTVPELVVAIGSSNDVDPLHAAAITETVLAHLRQLVPEEVADVAAVLPKDLRELWSTAVPG